MHLFKLRKEIESWYALGLLDNTPKYKMLPSKSMIQKEKQEDKFRRGMSKSQWVQDTWSQFWEMTEKC